MIKIRLATVFSGIGSVEFALRRLDIPHEVVFACDNGERDIKYDKDKELDIIRNLKTVEEKKVYVDRLYDSKTKKHNFVRDTYLNNYSIKDDLFFQDINLLDGNDFKNQVDLFVGGSPCQSFSLVGSQRGLKDIRGTLFAEFARLIKEIEPKVFIYENVRNVIKHDNGRTWEVIKNAFDELEYEISYKILNAKDFNIPQKRSRLFVIGYKKSFGIKPIIPEKNEIPLQYTMQDFLVTHTAYGNFNYNEDGSLKLDQSRQDDVPVECILSKAVKEYVLKEGTKNWHQKVETDLPIARTLLKTMGNCHRAGVDNYVTENGNLRMLSVRECLRLMGYTDDFRITVSKAQTYKQVGNSIVVDVMMELVKCIISQKVLD